MEQRYLPNYNEAIDVAEGRRIAAEEQRDAAMEQRDDAIEQLDAAEAERDAAQARIRELEEQLNQQQNPGQLETP